ncbi:MAG: nucleotide exchange factor GrpE, partial [Gammaproteobacteria bacterium]|nr:nucleotide exchange factor GrpE [Gammaproteobacteria bacterium]
MSDKEMDQTEQEQLNEEVAESEAQQQADTGDDLSQRLSEAEAKAQEHWDQLLRTKAEMDNLRRRTERDLENAHKYALERFALELLPVKDSLEMGLSAAENEGAEVASLKEGTELTLKMLETAMEKFGIAHVHPIDEVFNPELHQAISMLESV